MKLAPLLVVCVTASHATADDGVAKHFALDASLGAATITLDDYTPALGVGAGAGVRLHQHVGIGLRAAAYAGDERTFWFIGPALEARFGGTSLAVSIGQTSLRRVDARDNGMGMLVGRNVSDSGTGIHARIAHLVWRQVEVSAELMTAEIETIYIDVGSDERYFVASTAIGYRFF